MELRQNHVPDHQIAVILRHQQPDIYRVFHEHEQALDVFLACQNQWRMVTGVRIVYQALDYASVESVMRLIGVKKRRRAMVFRQVQLIELGAVRTLNGKSQ